MGLEPQTITSRWRRGAARARLHRRAWSAAGAIAVCASASAWGQAAPAQRTADAGEWAVVGVREPDGASVAALVDDFRKALANELGSQGSNGVLGAQAILSKLGTSSAAVSAVLTHITDAEGAYQQFALDAARRKFEAGIQELAKVSGESSVWEATMTARVLLGMVYLAAQERDAAAHAQAEMESLLRVAPDFQVSGYSGDPVFLALFTKAQEKVRRLPKGALRVETASKRSGAQAWVDAAPKDPSKRIELPAGVYHVRVTDERDAPRLRSFTHVVTVKQGEETSLNVNLEVEGALDPAGGPSFVLSSKAALRSALPSVLGKHFGSGRMAFLWLDGQRNLRLAIGDSATGRLERAALASNFESGNRASKIADLASYAVSGVPRPGILEIAPALGDPPLAGGEPGPPQLRSPASGAEAGFPRLRVAAWSSAGAAAVMAALGIGLAVHASSSRGDLDKQYQSNGSVLVPYPSQASYRSQRDGQLSARRWGVGLMVGAGVAAAASATLFVLDANGKYAEPRASAGAARSSPFGFTVSF